MHARMHSHILNFEMVVIITMKLVTAIFFCASFFPQKFLNFSEFIEWMDFGASFSITIEMKLAMTRQNGNGWMEDEEEKKLRADQIYRICMDKQFIVKWSLFYCYCCCRRRYCHCSFSFGLANVTATIFQLQFYKMITLPQWRCKMVYWTSWILQITYINAAAVTADDDGLWWYWMQAKTNCF